MLAKLSFIERAMLVLATLFVIVGFVTLIRPEQLLIVHQAFRGPGRGGKAVAYAELISPDTARFYGLGAIIAGCGLSAFILRASRES
jgi:hypothetical protein